MVSAIQATEDETSAMLKILVSISAEQAKICGLLDQLILQMNMPSESVLRVLQSLLIPMGKSMAELNTMAQQVIGEN